MKITADDAQSVLERIIEIETGLNQDEQHSNIAGLNKMLNAVNTETTVVIKSKLSFSM